MSVNLPPYLRAAFDSAKPQLAALMAESAHERIRSQTPSVPAWKDCPGHYQAMMSFSYAETMLPLWEPLEQLAFAGYESLVVMTGRLEMAIAEAEGRGERQAAAEMRAILTTPLDDN